MLTTMKNNDQKKKEKQRIKISKKLQEIQRKKNLEKKTNYFIEKWKRQHNINTKDSYKILEF